MNKYVEYAILSVPFLLLMGVAIAFSIWSTL